MEINIKPKYEIEGPIYESDLIKINKILQDTIYPNTEVVLLDNGYYLLKLNTTQLTYILNYFLQKEVK